MVEELAQGAYAIGELRGFVEDRNDDLHINGALTPVGVMGRSRADRPQMA